MREIINILVNIILALLAGLALAAARAAKPKGREDQAACEQLAGAKALLAPVLIKMVTEAEQGWGAATGSLKFGDVLEKATKWITNYLPEHVRRRIPSGQIAQTLSAWIEEALSKAKKAWAEHPGILEL